MRSLWIQIPRAAMFLMACMLLFAGGISWLLHRYDTANRVEIPLDTFSETEYPENPERRSRSYGTYSHHRLLIERMDRTRFRFVLEPGSNQSTRIELRDVDLALIVAAIPRWALSDPDLTKVGLIDREWNRQQVRFARTSPHVQVQEGGDTFEQRTLSRVDLARNCLNAGLWELLLFTQEDGEDRVYEHVWFTFPLGLYKEVFEEVNGLSYWSFWWSLEHWVDPSGTPIHMDLIRTIEQEDRVSAMAQWSERILPQGEQVLKQRNILTPVAATYRDWYTQPVRFASFIPPGRYSRSHPRDTQLHYLADFTGAIVRHVALVNDPRHLMEIELNFRSHKTGEPTRLILGGLDVSAIPALPPPHYDRGWKAPFGIGNPDFFEDHEMLVSNPPMQRTFYGFHLDASSRWLDHHAIGVDGPLLHRDTTDPSLLHLYLLSYERHTLLQHVIISLPSEWYQAVSPPPSRQGQSAILQP